MIKQLNVTYKQLIHYCDSHSYSFREEDIARAYPYEEYLRKFQHSWFNGI